MTTPRTTIKDILSGGSSFLIAAHENPDGDALGSSVALAHVLTELGKDVIVYNASGIPDYLSWLSLPCPVVHELPEMRPEWVICLDSGDLDRLGDEFAESFSRRGSINIDHHLGNPEYAEINWVDPTASSVGEMIGQLAQELDVPLVDGLGEAVYLAMVTDTGHFSYGNTSPDTMRLAASIIESGLDVGTFNARLQNQWTLSRLHLTSKAYERAELHFAGQIATIEVTQSMLDETGSTREDCGDLVNSIRRIRGVKGAISLREETPSLTKVSLRAAGELDVRAISAELGGGGHKNAAGIKLNLSLEDAKALLLETASKYLPDGEA